MSTKVQQNSTETTHMEPQTKPLADQQDETAGPAQHASTDSQQTLPQAPSPEPGRKELTFEQKDFICKHIAAFKTYREVAGLFLAEFPQSDFTFDQVLKRIKYYSCDNRTRKWRFRILAYRDQLNHNLANPAWRGNKYERLRHLEAMFHEALQPRLKRLFWHPTRRRKDDKMIYRAFKVYERDLSSAARILSLIAKELDPESLEALEDPFMVQRSLERPQEFAAQLEAFNQQDPDASTDLDKTFGLI